MGTWNTDSGAAIHAELIGREWIKAGHQLSVFTFFKYSFHGTVMTNIDENYVTRCFTTSKHPQVRLDPSPFLKENYQIFIVEDLGMIPQDQLRKIFHWIKRKAKTVNIIHDGKLSEDPSFYQFDWDAVVGFDERYIEFLKAGYPKELLHQIPFPCHPLRLGDMRVARKSLNLPPEKKILFMFGDAARMGVETIPWILKYCSGFPIQILVVSKNKKAIKKASQYSPIADIKIREEVLTISQLYDYLHACDALILNKTYQPHVVISSTVLQCLGSGCPIIARDSNAVETLHKEILKFESENEFGGCLIDVLERGEKYKQTVQSAKDYVKKNSAEEVAEQFIELFECLL